MRSSEKFEVRVLRPVEFEKLRDAMDPDTKRICASLLLTGTRYAELQRLGETPTSSTCSPFFQMPYV